MLFLYVSFALIYKCNLFYFRLFTNALMAQFNMKGKGKKGKKSLEKTQVYRAIKGKPIFHVDQGKIISSCQSVNNELIGQNISFPVDI